MYDPNPIIGNFICTLNPILTNTTANLQVLAIAPDAQKLYFTWRLKSGSGVLSGADDGSNKTFTAPSNPTPVTLSLQVRSASGYTTTRELLVIVTTEPSEVRTNSLSDPYPVLFTNGGPSPTNVAAWTAPIITSFTAGTNFVDKNTSTPLSVVASQPGGGALYYSFQQIAGPGILTGSDTANGKFYQAPGVNAYGGTVLIHAVVSNDYGLSSTNALALVVNKSWVTIGTPGLGLPSGVAWLSMALDSTGKPYVCFSDSNQSSRAVVMGWNGASWYNVGLGTVSATEAVSCWLAVNPSNNQPFVLYQEGGFARASQFDGGNWNPVGAGFGSSSPTNLSGGFDPLFAPYAACYDPGATRARVFHYDGAWNELFTAGFSAGATGSGNMAVDLAGNPVLAYQDIPASSGLSCQKWMGTWNYVGGGQNVAGVATPVVSLVVDAVGTPIIGYQDQTTGRASVVQYGAGWTLLGGSGFTTPGVTVATISMAVNPFGFPFIACDGAPANYPTVMKLSNATWQAVGSSSIGIGTSREITLKLDPGGDPFIAFRDGSAAFRPTVMAFK